jgi:hypothetical protein
MALRSFSRNVRNAVLAGLGLVVGFLTTVENPKINHQSNLPTSNSSTLDNSNMNNNLPIISETKAITKNLPSVTFGISQASANASGFAKDYALGKALDECLFNNCFQRGYNNYMDNWYNPIRKSESELSYIQQGRFSPLREQWEANGNPCVSDEEWMRLVRNGSV